MLLPRSNLLASFALLLCASLASAQCPNNTMVVSKEFSCECGGEIQLFVCQGFGGPGCMSLAFTQPCDRCTTVFQAESCSGGGGLGLIVPKSSEQSAQGKAVLAAASVAGMSCPAGSALTFRQWLDMKLAQKHRSRSAGQATGR